VTALANRLSMSQSNFAERFRDLAGEPPQRYFTRLRIHAAATRLTSSDDKLRAIRDSCGFRVRCRIRKGLQEAHGNDAGRISERRRRVRPPV
jgi:transcriptional regulator GlxA family with amidase domain